MYMSLSILASQCNLHAPVGLRQTEIQVHGASQRARRLSCMGFVGWLRLLADIIKRTPRGPQSRNLFIQGIVSHSIHAAKAVMDEQGTQEDAGPLAC